MDGKVTGRAGVGHAVMEDSWRPPLLVAVADKVGCRPQGGAWATAGVHLAVLPAALVAPPVCEFHGPCPPGVAAAYTHLGQLMKQWHR